MLIIAILCFALGSFISPIGTYTYTYMFKVIGGISSTFISELQQTDIISSIGMILGLIVIDILMLATKSKMKLSDILLFFGLYFMAILARRNQAFLYLIGTIPVVRLITNFFETYDTENILEKVNNFFSKNWVLGCTTIVIVIGLSSNMVTRIREKYVNEKKYPVGAVNFIKENLDYKNLKIYNSFNYGSYLELSGIPAFVDSRSEIFTEEFNNVTILKDWLETSRGNVNYNDTFEKYEIDYAIVEDKEIIKKSNIKSLIIDLRNNGGGIVSEALKIADFIADKDSVLLYEVDKNGKETVKKSENDPIVNMPIIVLVNGNTASSSEILAGALKDLGKAKIVGTKTYGKGVIQEILTLADGSGLKITTEEYQTPNRNKIHKKGIEPDENVELKDTVTNETQVEEKDDTQLQKAIEMLK